MFYGSCRNNGSCRSKTQKFKLLKASALYLWLHEKLLRKSIIYVKMVGAQTA